MFIYTRLVHWLMPKHERASVDKERECWEEREAGGEGGDRETEKEREKERDRDTKRDRDRQRKRERERKRRKNTHRETKRQTDRQTNRQTETKRERELVALFPVYRRSPLLLRGSHHPEERSGQHYSRFPLQVLMAQSSRSLPEHTSPGPHARWGQHCEDHVILWMLMVGSRQ